MVDWLCRGPSRRRGLEGCRSRVARSPGSRRAFGYGASSAHNARCCSGISRYCLALMLRRRSEPTPASRWRRRRGWSREPATLSPRRAHYARVDWPHRGAETVSALGRVGDAEPEPVLSDSKRLRRHLRVSPPALAPPPVIHLKYALYDGSVQRVGAERAAPTVSERPRQCMPAAVSCIAFNASSSVKVLGFWIGGKSLKVAAHWDAAACAP